ncbi:hypothetical protein [Macrococcoides canis]|uniref:Uncharacterized protein n=1 Tax=Macrococcoides canis TaxID=1855823 RepID=A0A1W7AB67_9STAP|nr:hypothetical protein [Macrococcus canis]ARQ06862.1 hypothetical protein MCCS_12160 [Macrococcus canis]QIH75895.1 hypothetical protein GTN31_05940 [Macrococcus canis]QTQ07058.1 hypothetical protein J9174_06280 [Macrococcus canis]QUR93494.1 hypothetical protein GOY09_00450 [Macrococcus canis]UJS26780.1 hypothetical protein L2Z53_06175 [Macrococcus canis]
MVVKIMIMLIGTLFYLLSGPVIKRILTSMSAIEMKTSDNIGLLIGYIERMLVILFFILGEYTAIGLVIASKSILRFNDLKDDGQNHNPDKIDKKSEYILLGTMLSLLIGIINGIIFKLVFII